jgi:exopolyphosphatase/guanosine-5'-triphosphate,3'-diphosphate pyrophosphatase
MATPAQPPKKTTGLELWMNRVLEECDRASVAFAPDPVHDLRVALRRCRSLADGLMAIDPDPNWKQMKKAGKRLFSSLGELRDMQVMEEWVHRLDRPDDPVTNALLNFLASQEARYKEQAAQALQEFDRKQWRKWCKLLLRRAARFRAGGVMFQHLALERWIQAYALHQRALRNRSQVALHNLRIGIKRFRYIVENFLPQEHEAWSGHLKEMQDLLGDVHDLDVLWATALQVNAFPDPESKTRWHSRIIEERGKRVHQYRDKMLGKTGLWHVWRDGLPKGKQVEAIGLRRLKAWASMLDPDFRHSTHVTKLALQLYDGLPVKQSTMNGKHHGERTILQLAALMHDVGRSEREKGHHKDTFRLIRRITPPLGYSEQSLKLAAVVARYHRGALPRGGQKALQGLSLSERKEVTLLAGILRLANAFDAEQDGRIHRVKVQESNGALTIAAEGYSSRDRLAENIAAARHLLEVVYRRPIILKALRQPKIA